MADKPKRAGTGGPFQSGFLTWRNGVPDPAQAEALRARLGDEAVDRLIRARELRRNPRPLTEEERAVLDAVLDPVLADLRAANAIVPGVRYESWEGRGPDFVCAWITPPGSPKAGRISGSSGVSVGRFGPAGGRIADLADQVQEWEVEALAAAGRPATWPECPEHPRSHPLTPDVDEAERAVWYCPRSQRLVCAIGELGG
jgi:hypothetical protein